MSQYIMGLLGAAAVIGIMENLLPSGAKSAAYIKLIASLCLLCLAIRPISAAMGELPSLVAGRVEQLAEGGESVARQEYEAILKGQIKDTARAQLSAAVKQRLNERFGIRHCEVGVELQECEAGWEPKRIMVTLMGIDIFKDPYAIEAYVGEMLGCECVAVIG